MANYYDLHGSSTRIGWYPAGKGGPIKVGTPQGPAFDYTSHGAEVSVSGDDLTIAKTPAGTFVTAVVKKSGIVPGGITTFSVLFPDVVDGDSGVAIHTIGIVAVHRGTAQLGPGQLETYTEHALKGTASNIPMPL